MLSVPRRLRVVFTGHTGIQKRLALDRLCSYVREQIRDANTAVYHAEHHLVMDTFLDAAPRVRRQRWTESLRTALQQVRMENVDYAFLSLHLTYQRHGRFFSPASWYDEQEGEIRNPLISLLKDRFCPDYFVTLTDDVQDVWHRILHSGFPLRLKEIMTWRTLEAMFTDMISHQTIDNTRKPESITEYPFERSPIFPVRQQLSSLFRFLFHPLTPRIYLSYPMTASRDNAARRTEINRFRSHLSSAFTTFDPTSIDEYPLVNLYDSHVASTTPINTPLTLEGCRRWEVDPAVTLCGQARGTVDGLRFNDLVEVAAVQGPGVQSIIGDQIERRDLRFIDQSDCLVSYRPMMNTGDGRETFSGGTGAEWLYAGGESKARFIVHDSSQDGALPVRVWRHHAGETPHIFEEKGLSNQDNQARVLHALCERLKQKAPAYTRLRFAYKTRGA